MRLQDNGELPVHGVSACLQDNQEARVDAAESGMRTVFSARTVFSVSTRLQDNEGARVDATETSMLCLKNG
ncbi:hypothetical protein NDU88_001599 [Pleurodeles waltl]|uniref:Uncharacterized protein n=1 Tax=Pleurodeles waltl TaxID=8319 RepID=A0AAV7WMF5_PLEWA|nr:hypothetical protein NDU88_001599 [Pleurodeles waltl]